MATITRQCTVRGVEPFCLVSAVFMDTGVSASPLPDTVEKYTDTRVASPEHTGKQCINTKRFICILNVGSTLKQYTDSHVASLKHTGK